MRETSRWGTTQAMKSLVCMFVPFLMLVGCIGAFVLWYVNKKKEIARAQESWARVVQRLGGVESPTPGIGGTRGFNVHGAVLMMTNVAGGDANLKGHVNPMGAYNSWQSHVSVDVRRPVPAFEIRSGKARGRVLTGNAGFDADWSVIPLLGADPRAIMHLLDESVMGALHALRGRPYQIYSGGYTVCGLLAGLMTTEREVDALLFVCRRLAGAV